MVLGTTEKEEMMLFHGWATFKKIIELTLYDLYDFYREGLSWMQLKNPISEGEIFKVMIQTLS